MCRYQENREEQYFIISGATPNFLNVSTASVSRHNHLVSHWFYSHHFILIIFSRVGRPRGGQVMSAQACVLHNHSVCHDHRPVMCHSNKFRKLCPVRRRRRWRRRWRQSWWLLLGPWHLSLLSHALGFKPCLTMNTSVTMTGVKTVVDKIDSPLEEMRFYSRHLPSATYRRQNAAPYLGHVHYWYFAYSNRNISIFVDSFCWRAGCMSPKVPPTVLL